LPTEIIRDVTKAQLDFIIHEPRLLAQRVRDRRIVEGHGDLRPEHVYLGVESVVTDCLEFNRAFRILDPADELAYLALECDMLGGHETGRRIIELYRELSGDSVPERLLDFYMSERACLRAKLAIWHLREQDARRPAKWRRRALKYLRLARSYALALSQRVMISDPGQSLDLKKLDNRAARVKPLDRRREKRR
jgi:aminoglycoside phosphotransferase family enzyme